MDYYLLQGTKGIFTSRAHDRDIDRISLIADDNPVGSMHWDEIGKYNAYLPDRYKNATEEQLNAGHGGGDFFIVEDFINAVRSETQPELDVYTACEWTAVGLLSSLSVVNGGRTMEVPRFRRNMPLDEKIIKL